MRLRNLVLGIRDQKLRDFLVGGSAWGIFHTNSHINRSTGKEKVPHLSKEKARKAADAMERRAVAAAARVPLVHAVGFDAYKCIFCDAYHIGRSR